MKWTLTLFWLPLVAQAQATVSAPWDIKQTATELGRTVLRLKPVLEQLNPPEWVNSGAPETYTSQWRSAQLDVDAIATAADTLQKQPEKLTVALDVYFKMQAMDARLLSLNEGVRKYQNPAVAELIVGLSAENSDNREKLRQYIADLAEQKEVELGVADREAQRCRAVLNRQPAAPPKPAVRAPGK
jgi:hypothetical protein